jgi:hypothetical protein
MERKELISTYEQSKNEFSSIQQELIAIDKSMREAKKDPKIKEYHDLMLRKIALGKKIKALKDELPWQEMLACDHMMFPSHKSEIDYEGRTYVDYSCCRCGLTSMFNELSSRYGDYYYQMKETYLKVFLGFYPPPSMRITGTIYPYAYMQQLYRRAIKIVGDKDRDKIIAKIFELEKKDKEKKEKQKTIQMPKTQSKEVVI